jgi:hypothetical protein
LLESHARTLLHSDVIALVRDNRVRVSRSPRAGAATKVATEEDTQSWCGGTDYTCLKLDLCPYEEVEGGSCYVLGSSRLCGRSLALACRSEMIIALGIHTNQPICPYATHADNDKTKREDSE